MGNVLARLNTVRCERRDWAHSCRAHSHSYGQLIIPVRNNLDLTIASQNIVNVKEIIFVPPNTKHFFHISSINESFVMKLPSCFLPSELGQSLKGHFKFGYDERWAKFSALLATEVGEEPVSNQSMNELSRYAIHLLTLSDLPPSIKYIHENYHSPLTVERLAEIERYTETYYYEWFQKNTGVSPGMYVQKLRLQKARQLLQTTDLPITQIAYQVGYNYPASLNRAFRKACGSTPMEFRVMSRELDYR